ncbi:stage II sporulation protein R [Desulfofarcimen acetoxidans DSM 771]|uniref:Stage II sporulation protein R n=1 Tax=Desulfofarcimen acetoxidans (strain ATCC 49208 / DSM 771 / KCTC 5769 / VKM B-1644 / 5575) TaxID=485916 RepID=C8W486_DESAS|nr:stage II sporulation protein R [Desulfofarcimen acetoxidans]ACV61954.1 stage II sporulation protein R [Desulfofarcimen acetoxidans DSM 771]
MRDKFMAGAVLLTIVGMTYVVYWHAQKAKVSEAYNANNLIRFHVIANSDTEADQTLKLKVRDKVVRAMTPSFSQAGNVDEARVVVKENLSLIKSVASQEIAREGKDYPVQVSLGNYMFPTKTYGNLTLEAGEYEAVRVVIGEGKGANWWCVLFPPLCFVDFSADQEGINIPEKAKGVSLAETPKQQTDSQVQVKFRVVEVFEDSVTRVVRVLGKHLVAFTGGK